MECYYGNQNPNQFAGNQGTMQINNGGYPYGYPPTQFPQYQMPIPGVTSQLELTDTSGNSVVVPPAYQNHIQGGATVSPGGFNPLTGITTPTSAEQGYTNPYSRFIGNPGYGIPQQPQQQQSQGIYPYYPGMNTSPYMKPYNNPLLAYTANGHNEFNMEIQQLLYEQDPSCMTTKDILNQIILSDEEREKIQRSNGSMITGYDYYGRPIYNNGNSAYQANMMMQQQFEEARHNIQTHFTSLSKIAHAYFGEKIDEQSAMDFFDPVPKQEYNQEKVFNFYNATPEEKEEYKSMEMIRNTNILDQYIQKAKMMEQQLVQQKLAAFDQIKASHDRLIGVEPGEHYDLKTYMENGYKLNVNMAMKAVKSANRNGTNKYSRNGYRASLAQINKVPVPITSKDDEYVSIDQTIKAIYDRSKRPLAPPLGIIRDPNTGVTSYTSDPVFPDENSSEFEAHRYFLQATQDKKYQDDARRSVL